MVSLEAAHSFQEQLLSYLKEKGISFDFHSHPVVLTVEEQAKHFSAEDGALAKNIFLKDKKGRFILISALTATKVDLKLLSQRLGLGKSGLRLAPEENLATILQVPLGSVTPLALFHESARDVLLLLDDQLQEQSKILVHPLSNDATIGISAASLGQFLRSVGKDAIFVDLQAEVVVGKDQPPDLAEHLLAVGGGGQGTRSQEVAEGGEGRGEEVKKGADGGSKAAPGEASGSKAAVKATAASKSKTKVASPAAAKGPAGDDLSLCTARIEELLSDEMAKMKGADFVRSELQHILVMFKNAAYTHGFTAGLATKGRTDFGG